MKTDDDSFTKQGSIPFKWEIRPGVPKLQNLDQLPSHKNPYETEFRSVSPETPPKLKPPPAGFHFYPQLEPQTRSYHSSPKIPSRRFRLPVLAQPDVVSLPAGFHFYPQLEPQTRSYHSSPNIPSSRFRLPVLAQPDVVSLSECFQSPLVKRKHVKRSVKSRGRRESEYSSDFDTPSRWSVSSRRSVSPLSSSFASDMSSPSPYTVSDAEWAALAMF